MKCPTDLILKKIEEKRWKEQTCPKDLLLIEAHKHSRQLGTHFKGTLQQGRIASIAEEQWNQEIIHSKIEP